jgi:hypothetical protein
MKSLYLLALLLMGSLLPLSLKANIDTIFTNNDKIICTVKEITPDAVRFTYPGEELINTVYKNTVQKIAFSSGRVQVFAESTSLKKVTGPGDFENVTTTKVESEVKGLFKLGEVSSKAKGTTDLSNQERVKQRALRKLKIEAAMMGANLVYITDSRTQGNVQGNEYTASQSSEASFTGVAYTNVLPKFSDFRAQFEGKKNLVATELVTLWSSGSDMTYKTVSQGVTIERIYDEAGLIMVDASVAKVKNSIFRVVSFSGDSFVLVYRDKSSIYNLRVAVQ